MVFLNQDRKFTHINLDIVDSTQDEALRLFKKASCGNFIITSKILTSGRGRNGNEWIAPPGNLNFTMFLSSDLDNIIISQLPFILSLAVFEVIRSVINRDKKIMIKWPNDILINDKKVAGILIETGIKPRTKKFDYINIGIGVNISSIPEIVGRKITSVNENSSRDVCSEDLVEPIKTKILTWLDWGNVNGAAAIKEKWLQNSQSFGTQISTTYNGTKVTGIFEDLGEMGEMILKLPDGSKLVITSGVIE